MTELTEFQRKLSALLPDVELRFEEALAKHTSFRIGGDAEVMAFPKTKIELADILKACAKLNCKCAILGAGTNVLAPDEGVRGLVVCLKDCLGGMERLDETHIRVMAGVTMARAAVNAANMGLTGMEFAHGIPGTVGGGVYMNAGAYGGEICQICESVEVMDLDGNLSRLSNAEMAFSYRHSALENRTGIVVSAVFCPEKGKLGRNLGKNEGADCPPYRFPAVGRSFGRFCIQTPDGRLCGGADRRSGTEGLSGRRRGDLREARRVCRQSGRRDGGGCEGSAVPGVRAGLSEKRHPVGAGGSHLVMYR